MLIKAEDGKLYNFDVGYVVEIVGADKSKNPAPLMVQVRYFPKERAGSHPGLMKSVSVLLKRVNTHEEGEVILNGILNQAGGYNVHQSASR